MFQLSPFYPINYTYIYMYIRIVFDFRDFHQSSSAHITKITLSVRSHYIRLNTLELLLKWLETFEPQYNHNKYIYIYTVDARLVSSCISVPQPWRLAGLGSLDLDAAVHGRDWHRAHGDHGNHGNHGDYGDYRKREALLGGWRACFFFPCEPRVKNKNWFDAT